MASILQAKNVTLRELGDRFGFLLTEDASFFPEWQLDLPEVTPAEQQRLDRVKSSFSNLLEYPPLLENTVKMVVLSPLLDMADFYLPPFHIKSEPSTELTLEDEGMLIRGQLDVLVLRDLIWVVAIESKNAEFSLEAGRAQLLSSMLANPPAPRYGLSRVFDLFNPGHDLYEVLKILKSLKERIIRPTGNGTL
ncbi:MAG: restriction endonuclease subunit R [Oculatellaceae cyanobacterium Prado106]|nr:restriction endonuclease subunit R [Oculatellaceae cyanobacterium Prado106]